MQLPTAPGQVGMRATCKSQVRAMSASAGRCKCNALAQLVWCRPSRVLGSNFSVSCRCIFHHSFFLVPFLIPPLALTFTIHRSPYRFGLRYLTGVLSHVNFPSQFCAIHSRTKRGSPGTVPILAFPLPGSAQSSHPVSRSSHKMQIFPTGDIPSRTSLTTHLARPEF